MLTGNIKSPPNQKNALIIKGAKRRIFLRICQVFLKKKWGNFRKIGSKSLEKYGLEKPRGYRDK